MSEHITIVPGNDVKVGPVCEHDPVDYAAQLEKAFSFKLEAHSKPSGTVQFFTRVNSLIEAANFAYKRHYPLYLSPDMIWLVITHGLSRHINLHAEQFREQFVDFSGKNTITVIRDGFVKGEKNPWENVFPEFASKIRDYIGQENHDLIVADYSTTTEVSRIASQIVLMESMQAYFSYGMRTTCGIPYYKIDGTEDDWGKMLERVAGWDRFGLTWWLPELKSLLQKFVDAKKGEPTDWTSFYKSDGGSGGPFITGEVLKLFPYSYSARTPNWKEMRYIGRYTDDRFPSSFSTVPFWWDYHGTNYNMAFVAGLLGFVLHDDLTTVPQIGWAVTNE